MANNSFENKDNHYSAKPPIFVGEKFDYWKDRIESFFLGYDADLWDLVIEGYEQPKDAEGNIVSRSSMTDAQKKMFKDHHKARTILLNAISYTEYEKITNRETAKSIFDSLQMTHEGNTQVKETKALALIQKYEAFRMEEEESVETMFSRFQMLVAGLIVLDKGYSTTDHVKKIIRSLPKKWRPMVTSLKMAKDLTKISLEELISSLRSHEIEREEDERALSSRRTNHLWKEMQGKKFHKGPRNAKGRFKSTSGQKKASDKEVICFKCKEVICFKCKEPEHYKNEC